jgi:hypothetical protein
LEQIRVSPGQGVQLAAVGALAAVCLWLAVQARLEGGRPPAYMSALIVCGLLALHGALLRLAALLGADFGGFPDGAYAWTGAVQAAAAATVSAHRNSAIAALIAAIATGIAVTTGWDWLFDPGSVTPYRWLLLALALAFALSSLPLRSVSLRHAEQMVNAAGLAILAIALLHLLTSGLLAPALSPLPGFWELVLLAGGFGLIAYAGADRAPGPAWLGAIVLLAFVVIVGFAPEGTLRWWPLTLLVVGVATLAFALRPRAPLPPEPSGYRKDEMPLAARTEDDVVRVHHQ